MYQVLRTALFFMKLLPRHGYKENSISLNPYSYYLTQEPLLLLDDTGTPTRTI